MNLKEAFRYQNFLSSLLHTAGYEIVKKEHCLKTTNRHLIKEANPELENKEEVVKTEDFIPNDVVIRFMEWAVNERLILTQAINKAKTSASIDIDAAIETNKSRQYVSNSIKNMLKYTSSKTTDTGIGYKFNAEGNQTEYIYTVEVETSEAYDREKSKEIMYQLISDSDKASAEIDHALINTEVDYNPIYNVNMDFDDVIKKFSES